MNAVNFDVQTLRRYIAVAEELHFARAAKSLNIARTALSATINEMEAELGYSLFEPGTSPTQLTEQGSRFLETARISVDEDERRLLAEARARATRIDTLTVGITEGVTPTKWTRIFAERFPDVALELVPTTARDQLPLVHDGSVDIAFVRLPIERDGLSVVALYEEVPVVVAPKEHPVAAFERVTVVDLADEHLLQSADEVPEWAAVASELADGSAAAIPPIASNSELIEYVAAGLGLAIVPQSIARLHARKDLVYRPVDGVAGSSIAIAWVAAQPSPHVDEFFGIVRGRSVRSSRGTAPEAPVAKKRKPTSATAAKKSPDKSTPNGQRRRPTKAKRPKR